MESCDLTPLQHEYCGAIAAAAFDALIRHWLERGCAETPEQLCDLLIAMLPQKRGEA